MTTDNLIAQEIQDKFLTLLQTDTLVEDLESRIIQKIDGMLNNPEISKHIHLSHLKQVPFYPSNRELRKYMAEKRKEHNHNINSAINNNGIEFIKYHFSDWFNSTYNAEHPQTKNIKEKQFHYFFYNACKASANDVVKYFLTDEDLMYSIDSEIEIDREQNKAIKIAYSRNNIQLLEFFLYSPELKKNTAITQFEYDVNYPLPNEETQHFLYTYEQDIDSIRVLNDVYFNSRDSFTIESIKNMLEDPLLIKYPHQQSYFINVLSVKACRKNDHILLEKLFNLNVFHVQPNIFHNNQEAFLVSCQSNSVDCLHILLKQYEKQALTKKQRDFNDIESCFLDCSQEGFTIAAKYNAKEVIQILSSIPGYCNTNMITTSFGFACNEANKEIIDILLENSFNHEGYSSILAIYPYGINLQRIIKKNIDVEKKIDILEYLLDNPKLNPFSEFYKEHEYLNYEIKNINSINSKKICQDAFSEAQISVIDFLFEHNIIRQKISEIPPDELLKLALEQEHKNVLDYLIFDFNLEYNHLVELYLHQPVKVNEVGNLDDYSELFNYVKELYETRELKESLTEKMQNKVVTINTKKKKI